MGIEKNKNTLYSAYDGDGQYIFVSYAHRDADIVFPEICNFQNHGYNVWYDEGIAPGNEWPEEIANALVGSSLFVVFITPNSVASKNVRNEIYHALHHEIPFIAIHLVETELEGGLALSLQSMQAILKYNMSEEEYTSKYTNSFKNKNLLPSNSDNQSKSVPRNVKPIKKEDNVTNKILRILFYWKDDNGNLNVAKTKIVSIIGAILFFLIVYFTPGNDLGTCIIWSIIIGVFLFIVGFCIHYFINLLQKR